MNSIGVPKIKPTINNFNSQEINNKKTTNEKQNLNDKSIFEALKEKSGPQIFSEQNQQNTAKNTTEDQNILSLEALIQLLLSLLNGQNFQNTAKPTLSENSPLISFPTTPATSNIFKNNTNPITANQTVATNPEPKQTTNNNIFTNQTKNNTFSDKLTNSITMIKDYLQNTGNTKLLNSLNDSNLKISENNLQSNILGLQQGNSITLNSSFINNSGTEEIAGVLLHEVNHFSKGSTKNSIQEEKESEILRESFLDSKGKGTYNEQNENSLIEESVRRRYAGLPEA